MGAMCPSPVAARHSNKTPEKDKQACCPLLTHTLVRLEPSCHRPVRGVLDPAFRPSAEISHEHPRCVTGESRPAGAGIQSNITDRLAFMALPFWILD
ncbi:unnamed protein product [Diplocarpon coronariae]|nr:hypothetical protein JHW43_009372 [Diplocarpon mali]